VLKELIKVANSLDAKGFHEEADRLDKIIIASQGAGQYEYESVRVSIQNPSGIEAVVSFIRSRGDDAQKDQGVAAKNKYTNKAGGGDKSVTTDTVTIKTPMSDELAGTPWSGELELNRYDSGDALGQPSFSKRFPFKGLEVPGDIQAMLDNAKAGNLEGIVS